MNARTARALGAGGAVGVALAMSLPAVAEDLGVGWEGEITDARIVEGYEATDEVLRVPVQFEYTGPPDSVITSMTLELVPTDDRCQSRAFVQPLADGDGDPTDDPDTPDTTATTGTTATTATTVRPPSPSGGQTTHTASWPFRVDPGCNGVYDLHAYAVADPAGPSEPGDPGTESEPLVVEGIRVSLLAPRPSHAEAIAGADRTVTVRWVAPEAWTGADGVPADARGYRVERATADGSFVTVGETGVDGSSVVDDDLVTAPAGSYRYRVVAVRAAATGAPLASSPVESVVELGAAPPAPGAPGAAGGPRGRTGTAGRGAGQPAVAPPGEFDPGFDPELDYAEFGAAEAEPPGDASLFDVVTDDPVGVGLAVPAAVGLCLAVWAGHLRHLSRRAAPPYS